MFFIAAFGHVDTVLSALSILRVKADAKFTELYLEAKVMLEENGGTLLSITGREVNRSNPPWSDVLTCYKINLFIRFLENK